MSRSTIALPSICVVNESILLLIKHLPRREIHMFNAQNDRYFVDANFKLRFTFRHRWHPESCAHLA